ncbi:MAG: sigma-70 family RNA polymerase sigma factor [Succinivibrio sp.]|nr:sigma-70 family RNA polymerase sigma factor [Succinivibrio sp.]
METLNDIANASSDAAIVKRVLEGDKNAYQLLVVKYQHKVLQIASKFASGNTADASDIAQDAFIKAYRALGSFRGDSSFYTWLYRIVVNAGKNFIETKNRYHADVDVDAADFESKDSEGVLTSSDTPDKLIESEELQDVILKALEQLPPDLKQAIMLREVEGMAYEDIAVVMKIPVGTVRSRIFRARKFIEDSMSKLTK